MIVNTPILCVLGVFVFAIGSVVGSFLNVCIYRIPWQKSSFWPDSRCPKCYHKLAARDNVPILGWLALRGECRYCGARIAARYPFVEALTGLLFVAVFLVDFAHAPRAAWGEVSTRAIVATVYHAVCVALLVAATFIDYDLTIIPDEITLPGLLFALGAGALFPWVRPDPMYASTWWAGLRVGLIGLAVGGGITQSVRLLGSLALRREAMGFGDVTLMAMIGSFLGWQAAVLTFFLGAFYGLGHALVKIVLLVVKWLSGRKLSVADRELPFGPYLSMAAATLMLGWPWIWPGWARGYFETLRVVFLFLTGLG